MSSIPLWLSYIPGLTIINVPENKEILIFVNYCCSVKCVFHLVRSNLFILNFKQIGIAAFVSSILSYFYNSFLYYRWKLTYKMSYYANLIPRNKTMRIKELKFEGEFAFTTILNSENSLH